MPTARENITNQVLTLLEADADVIAYFTRAGNRGIQSTTTWLRDLVARAPADFRRFTIDVVQARDSMWTRADGGFAAEDPDYHERAKAGGIEVPRDTTFNLVITVREELPKAGVISAPEKPIADALFKAGTRMGLPDLVMEVGELIADRRDTREDERPYPGTVTTIRWPITARENGLDILPELSP